MADEDLEATKNLSKPELNKPAGTDAALCLEATKDIKPSSDDLQETRELAHPGGGEEDATRALSSPEAKPEGIKKNGQRMLASKSPSSVEKTGAVKVQTKKDAIPLSLSIKRSLENSLKSFAGQYEYHKPAIGWAIALLSLVIIFFLIPIFDRFELVSFDMRYKLKKNIPGSDKIVIAEINDQCKELYGRMGAWPWSRKIHAQIAGILSSFFNPEMIAFDILFLGHSEEELTDLAFAKKIKKIGNIYLPVSFEFSDEENKTLEERAVNIQEPYEIFKKGIKGAGHVNFKEDKDDKLRRVPLVINFNKNTVPHLAFQMVLDYLGISLKNVKFTRGKNISFSDSKGLKYIIPVDNEYQMILAWPGSWVNSFKHISCLDIIQTTAGEKLAEYKSAIDPNIYQNKVIIIGDTTTASVDVRPTPFDKRCPLVNVNAAIFNQIINRTFIFTTPVWVNFTLCFTLAGLIGVFAVRYTPLKGLLLTFLIFIFIAFFSITLLLFFNIWIELVRPLMTVVLTFLILGTYSHVRFKDHVDLKLSFEQKLSMADARLPQFRHNLKIGNYSNISELGRGGMAIVYKGTGKDGLNYAIKVINPECLAKDKLFKYRFKREIETMKKVVNPYVIRIYDSGSYQGVLYYAMELFPAGDLADNIPKLSKMNDWKWIANFFAQLAGGLKAIHDAGLVHRDIKPANIMMNDNFVVKIADFGLAKPVEEGQILTTVGQVLGTPAYLAPELCTGENPGFQADIYAMGIVLFEIASGYRPFQECTSMAALMQSKLKGPIATVKLRRPGLPSELAGIIDKMVAYKTDDRYRNCGEIITDLNNFIESLSKPAMAPDYASKFIS